MKQKIIDNIYTLLLCSIMKPLSYTRRSRGFISELKFKQKCIKDKVYFNSQSFYGQHNGALQNMIDSAVESDYITLPTEQKIRKDYKKFNENKNK